MCTDPDTYFKALDAQCYECRDAFINLGWTALAVVLTALLLATSLKMGCCRRSVQRVWWRACALWRKIGLGAKLKQLVTNVQVLAALPRCGDGWVDPRCERIRMGCWMDVSRS